MAVAPQNIMATLRSMPDAQLAQYAAMHKNDPFIFPLAFQESQNRKHVRAAEQAKGAGQEAPKVVDQDLAEMQPASQMLPEDVGIAQLPAQNIQGMAGGGIVAFEEGGRVQRFQNQGYVQEDQMFNVLPPGAMGSVPPKAASETSAFDPIMAADLQARKMRGYGLTDTEKARLLSTQALKEQQRAAGAEAAAKGIPFNPSSVLPPAATKPATQQTIPQSTPPAVSKEQVAGGVDKLIGDKGDTSAAPPTAPGAGLPSLSAYKKDLEDVVYKNAPTKEGLMKEFEAIDKPLVEKIQAGIDKEASRLKSDKEQDFYMSLIQGGLAAAAESGPNALQNIAKGLAVGAGNYKEALKDFRKATQENTRMETELAKYQATGKKDALKAYYDAQARRDDRYAQGLVSMMTQQMQTQGQIAAAGAGARAGADAQIAMLERIGKAKEGSPLLTGLERKTQEDKIPRLYADYTKLASDPMKGEEFMRKYPTFEVYRAGMGGSGGGQFINIPDAAAPSTAVRARPN